MMFGTFLSCINYNIYRFHRLCVDFTMETPFKGIHRYKKKTEIIDRILPTDIFLSINLNYRWILPTDSQILITDKKICR